MSRGQGIVRSEARASLLLLSNYPLPPDPYPFLLIPWGPGRLAAAPLAFLSFALNLPGQAGSEVISPRVQ